MFASLRSNTPSRVWLTQTNRFSRVWSHPTKHGASVHHKSLYWKVDAMAQHETVFKTIFMPIK